MALQVRRATRRRCPIYPRFRYQSPTKGDATTRRASATRSHEPSRGTKLLARALSLSLSLSFAPSPSYSRSRVPSFSSSSATSPVSQPTPPPSFVVSHGTPRSLELDGCSCTRTHARTHARTRVEPTDALAGERARAPTYAHAATYKLVLAVLANDRCIYLFSRFRFSIAKSPGELLDEAERARVSRCLLSKDIANIGGIDLATVGREEETTVPTRTTISKR